MYDTACIKFAVSHWLKQVTLYMVKSRISRALQTRGCNIEAMSAAGLPWVRPLCEGASVDGLMQ